MKEIIGFALVILSAFPMGIAEGKIIEMNSHYSVGRLVPVVLLYLLGFLIYLGGFMQIPTKIGFIVGIWEMAAVTIAITFAISKSLVKWDKDFTILYLVIIGSTYILGLAADKLLTKAGLE